MCLLHAEGMCCSHLETSYVQIKVQNKKKIQKDHNNDRDNSVLCSSNAEEEKVKI